MTNLFFQYNNRHQSIKAENTVQKNQGKILIFSLKEVVLSLIEISSIGCCWGFIVWYLFYIFTLKIMYKSLRCEDCNKEITSDNARIVFKTKDNWIFIWPKIIEHETHNKYYYDYKNISYNKLNEHIFYDFIEKDIDLSKWKKIPLNFLNNWLEFISTINHEYYKSNKKSKNYITYKKINNLSDDEKKGYHLSKLIRNIDEIDELYSSKIIKNRIIINSNLFYDKDNYIFYDSKNKEVLNIFKKWSWWKKIESKPESYDSIILILFMYLFENHKEVNHIRICNEDIFKKWLDYIYSNEFLRKNYIFNNDDYIKYFFSNPSKKSQNLIDSLNNNLKTNFKIFPLWIVT